MARAKKRKVAKPVVAKRPTVNHGGKRIEIPLLSAPVGPPHPDLKAKYASFNAAPDVAMVEYYLSQLAEIKFLSTECKALQKPDPKLTQVAEVVQCWDTHRDAAIRAFQGQLSVRDPEESKYGIVRPDGPTLTALVDYGDLAEKLLQLRGAEKDPQDFIHTGGFDAQKFKAALESRKSKNPYFSVRFTSTTFTHAWTLIELMQKDALILDLRWMAYMLATGFWEGARTIPVQVPQLDKHKKPILDKLKNPVMRTRMDWDVIVPIDEIAPSAKKLYKAPVKVKKLPDGTARITEQDGEQFTVALNGTFRSSSGKKAEPGALPPATPNPTYAKDDGVEYAYFGRGYVQLTWWYNYASSGVAIDKGLSLLFDPESVKQPEIAYRIMSHCMRTGAGFANKHQFAHYFAGSKKDYVNAREMVNGHDNAKAIGQIAELFEEMLREAKR